MGHIRVSCRSGCSEDATDISLSSTFIYLKLGKLGDRLLQSKAPSFMLRLPNDRPKSKTSRAPPQPATGVGNGEWLTVKEKKRKAPTAERNTKPRKRTPAIEKPIKRTTMRKTASEVIDLLNDESSAEEDIAQRLPREKSHKTVINYKSSDEEFELDE
jgi:hypothetical protein